MAVVRWQVLEGWESRRGVQLTRLGRKCMVRMAEISDILRSLVVGEKAIQNAQVFLPARESVPSGDEVNREFTWRRDVFLPQTRALMPGKYGPPKPRYSATSPASMSAIWMIPSSRWLSAHALM